MGNIDVDYKVHGFEDLRLHVTAGADIATGKQLLDESPAYPSRDGVYYGNHGWEKIDKNSYTMSGYAQYYHDFNDKAMNHFDIMLGSEYQRFVRSTHNYYYGYYPETNNDKTLAGTIYKPKGKDYDGDGTIDPYYDPTENRLLSFFACLLVVMDTATCLTPRYVPTFIPFQLAQALRNSSGVCSPLSPLHGVSKTRTSSEKSTGSLTSNSVSVTVRPVSRKVLPTSAIIPRMS